VVRRRAGEIVEPVEQGIVRVGPPLRVPPVPARGEDAVGGGVQGVRVGGRAGVARAEEVGRVPEAVGGGGRGSPGKGFVGLRGLGEILGEGAVGANGRDQRGLAHPVEIVGHIGAGGTVGEGPYRCGQVGAGAVGEVGDDDRQFGSGAARPRERSDDDAGERAGGDVLDAKDADVPSGGDEEVEQDDDGNREADLAGEEPDPGVGGDGQGDHDGKQGGVEGRVGADGVDDDEAGGASADGPGDGGADPAGRDPETGAQDGEGGEGHPEAVGQAETAGYSAGGGEPDAGAQGIPGVDRSQAEMGEQTRPSVVDGRGHRGAGGAQHRGAVHGGGGGDREEAVGEVVPVKDGTWGGGNRLGVARAKRLGATGQDGSGRRALRAGSGIVGAVESIGEPPESFEIVDEVERGARRARRCRGSRLERVDDLPDTRSTRRAAGRVSEPPGEVIEGVRQFGLHRRGGARWPQPRPRSDREGPADDDTGQTVGQVRKRSGRPCGHQVEERDGHGPGGGVATEDRRVGDRGRGGEHHSDLDGERLGGRPCPEGGEGDSGEGRQRRGCGATGHAAAEVGDPGEGEGGEGGENGHVGVGEQPVPHGEPGRGDDPGAGAAPDGGPQLLAGQDLPHRGRYAGGPTSLELRHLRYFVAVAEEGGFTPAARRVHVAQQVLSAQVRQLEGLLGVTLLERTSRGVRLTTEGEAFLAGAVETLRRLDQTVTSVRHQAAGTLAIGLNVAAGGEIPTTLLAGFERANPDVRVELRTFDLSHPAAGLLSGASDVAFVRPPVDAPGIELRQVGEEGRVVVLPLGHPLAPAETIRLDEIVAEPWVAAAPAVDGCRPRSWRDNWLAVPRPDGRAPAVGAVAATIDEWREHVAAGRGLSLCPASAERYYTRPDLAFVAAVGVPPARLCVAWRTDDPNPLVSRFVQFATETSEARSA
jgi:DNA-binding transcriptional LysR family regulator